MDSTSCPKAHKRWMKKDRVYCVSCGKKSVREVRRTIHMEYGILIQFYLKHVRMMECGSCRYRYPTKDQRKERTRAFNARVRSRIGLLPPNEWIRVRNILGLNRTSFERALGLTPSRASQIELDLVVPTLTEDTLARLILRDVGLRNLIGDILATREKEKKKARKKPRKH